MVPAPGSTAIDWTRMTMATRSRRSIDTGSPSCHGTSDRSSCSNGRPVRALASNPNSAASPSLAAMIRSARSRSAAGASARANATGSMTVLAPRRGRVCVRPMEATVDHMGAPRNTSRTLRA